MVGVAVDLHDHLLPPPQEIDLETADTGVSLRKRQPGGVDQHEQPPLRLRPAQAVAPLQLEQPAQHAGASPGASTLEHIRELAVTHEPERPGIAEGELEVVERQH